MSFVVTQYQRLNFLLNFYEIQFLKKLSSKCGFCESWLPDSHILLKDLNVFILLLAIILADCNEVWSSSYPQKFIE